MRAGWLVLLLVVAGCGNVGKAESSAPPSVESAQAAVRPGMSREDAESALGGPGVPIPSARNAFRYTAGSGAIVVRYENGVVASVEADVP